MFGSQAILSFYLHILVYCLALHWTKSTVTTRLLLNATLAGLQL